MPQRGSASGLIGERLLAKPGFPKHPLSTSAHIPQPLIVSEPTQPFTISPSKFDATVSFARVRPLAVISSTERRMRVASG
jgi:hypothetical protein